MNYAFIQSIFRNMYDAALGVLGSGSTETRVAVKDNQERGRHVVGFGVHVCGVTDVGRVREHNEDTFYVSEDGRLLIVADGMGGHAAGEVASGLAIDTIVELFSEENDDALPSDAGQVESFLAQALETADRIILEAAQEVEARRGMGTTVIVGYIFQDVLHTCHVGDVRAYVRNADGLAQITDDHSLVGALVRAGHITADEARVHPQKNEILQAVGTPRGITPSVHARTLSEGDVVVLCSDGLWEAISDDELVEVLAQEISLQERAERLVDRANDAGGNDNITVVLYEHGAG